MRLDPFRSVIAQRRLRDAGAPPKQPLARVELPLPDAPLPDVGPLAPPPHVFAPLAELPEVKAELDRLPEPTGVLQGWWQQTVDTVHGRHGTRELTRARKIVD